MSSTTIGGTTSGARRGLSALAIAAGVALAAVLLTQRTLLARDRPLWFDEAWTLSVATTRDWRSFLAEAHNDVNPPLYYAAMRLWTALAGTGDFALRLPGLIGAVAAAAIPLLWRSSPLDRGGRMAWAAMIFGWWGVGQFLDGRCYGLLLALSTLQVIAFARLLARPALGAAVAWCALASAAILTQYVAAIPAAIQGLIFVAVHPRRALAAWPALAAFAPALAWLAFHADQLARFASPAVAWHRSIGATDALALLAWSFGPATPLILPLAAAIVVVALLGARRRPDPGREAGLAPLWLAAGAAGLGLAAMLALGALKPMLVARYLLPLAPGLLLAPVLAVQRSAPSAVAYALLAGLYLAAPLRPGAWARVQAQPVAYGYETASATLMRHGVRQVVYLWDHETVGVEDPRSLARAGGVFFRRAGYPVTVTPVSPRPGDDANRLALAAATGEQPGIIWLYNRNGGGSARTHEPNIPALDPRWSCERVGDATVGTLACWRRGG